MKSEINVRVDREIKDLVVLAEAQGWSMRMTSSGRIEFLPADRSHAPVVISPRSNGRSLKNATAALQRAGLDVSSLKPEKAKVDIEAPQPEEVIDVTKTAKTPRTMQELIDAYQLSDSPAMKAALLAVEERARSGTNKLTDLSAALYITRVMEAAADLLEATAGPDRPCDVCREDAQKQVEKAETMYLESQAQLETAEKRIEKLQGDLSRLGTEYQKAKTGETEALERAVKAENRLRTLRSALADD